MSDNENNSVVTKYSSYTDAQKRATQKYRSNNKDKVNEQRKKYYQQRKESDPSFLEYKRQKAREYYQKKKLTKTELFEEHYQQNLTDVLEQNTPEVTNEPLPEPITELENKPLQEELVSDEPIETVEVKPKKKRAPRKKKDVVDV
jgi:glutaredoxin 2